MESSELELWYLIGDCGRRVFEEVFVEFEEANLQWA